MTVQDHLGREGRMPADLDGEMTPVRIEDVNSFTLPCPPEPGTNA